MHPDNDLVAHIHDAHVTAAYLVELDMNGVNMQVLTPSHSCVMRLLLRQCLLKQLNICDEAIA